MEIPEELARAAQKHKKATGRSAAVDDLTTAIMTGASPEEISRLEASTANSPHDDYAEAGQNDEQTFNQDGSRADGGRGVGDEPPNEHRNAERIRLTGLEERDKGLVNAANIIARTEGIPFDEAWRRVNGDVSRGHDDPAQARAGHEAQLQRSPDGDARVHDVNAHEALRQHHLQLAGELYHDLKNADSAHWREANRIATDPSHPDHDPEILAKPHAALIVAKLAAANLGLKGVHGGARVPAHQPGGVARPAAATKQSAPPPPRRSHQEIARASEQAAMDAVEGNTPPPTHRAARGYLRL